jgi:hypothetical protein
MQSGLAITPHTNLVSNVGWGSDATHSTATDHPTARVPTADIGTLRHPPHMIVHRAADRYTFDHALELEGRRNAAPATLSTKVKAIQERARASLKYRLTSGR